MKKENREKILVEVVKFLTVQAVRKAVDKEFKSLEAFINAGDARKAYYLGGEINKDILCRLAYYRDEQGTRKKLPYASILTENGFTYHAHCHKKFRSGKKFSRNSWYEPDSQLLMELFIEENFNTKTCRFLSKESHVWIDRNVYGYGKSSKSENTTTKENNNEKECGYREPEKGNLEGNVRKELQVSSQTRYQYGEEGNLSSVSYPQSDFEGLEQFVVCGEGTSSGNSGTEGASQKEGAGAGSVEVRAGDREGGEGASGEDQHQAEGGKRTGLDGSAGTGGVLQEGPGGENRKGEPESSGQPDGQVGAGMDEKRHNGKYGRRKRLMQVLPANVPDEDEDTLPKAELFPSIIRKMQYAVSKGAVSATRASAILWDTLNINQKFKPCATGYSEQDVLMDEKLSYLRLKVFKGVTEAFPSTKNENQEKFYNECLYLFNRYTLDFKKVA